MKEYCIQTSTDCLLKQARSQFFSLEIERSHLSQFSDEIPGTQAVVEGGEKKNLN